jgi:hypothetical protein
MKPSEFRKLPIQEQRRMLESMCSSPELIAHYEQVAKEEYPAHSERDMEEVTYRARIGSIPDPIRMLGYTNPAIHMILRRYGIGEIATKEEALCQMIIWMDKNWKEQQRRAFEFMMVEKVPSVT